MLNVEIGDAFLLRRKGIDDHLWVVISLPQVDRDNVIMVNLTSHAANKDQSCIAGPADHPWIQHQSCVSYRDAKCVSEEKLDNLRDSGELIPQDHASDEFIRKLLDGANITNAMPGKCLEILRQQDLAD